MFWGLTWGAVRREPPTRWGRSLCSPHGPPARRGHRFLFRKKAVGKNGPGRVPRRPLKVRPDGLIRKSQRLHGCGGPKAMAAAYEVPGEPGRGPGRSLPTAVEAGGCSKRQSKTFRQRRKALADMGTHLCGRWSLFSSFFWKRKRSSRRTGALPGQVPPAAVRKKDSLP